MGKAGRILLYTLLWVGIVGFVVFFIDRASRHYALTKIDTLDIRIADAGADCLFIAEDDVRQWLAEDSVATLSVPLDKVDIGAINRSIGRYDFIADVATRTTFDGRLIIELRQHKALFRLLCEGYDCYISTTAHTMHLQQGQALYAPVVTGSYQPPFPADYGGSVKSYIDSLIAVRDTTIMRLEEDKKPFEEDKSRLKERVKELSKQKLQQYDDEPDSEFAERLERHQAEKRERRRALRYEERLLDEQIAQLAAKQEQERKEQKKLLKRYEDFSKLINFVEYIEQNEFWRGEVVQIEAYSMSSGELALRIVPRSGSFVVEFGVPESFEQKLSNLERFYREGLNNVGWERFSSISVEYDGKVVATPRAEQKVENNK